MSSKKNMDLLLSMCGLVFLLDLCGCSVRDGDMDFRITQYSDLDKDNHVMKYTHPEIEAFVKFTLDIPRQQIILGAKNYLLRLDLEDFTELEAVKWEPENMTKIICQAKGQSSSECHNYIKVLLVHRDRLFTCGTNAFSPQCTWREAENLQNILSTVRGEAKCPFHPKHNNTALMTQDGNLFSGTVLDFNARDPAIFRLMGPHPTLRTVQNSKWLNEPNFVSSYEIGDFIYFFFRETAVEFINCGKTIYSRVARVCKNDKGGKFLLEDNWTSFSKARLNCSLPGEYPFYYNELQSTHYDENTGLIYGVFSTSPTSIYGSAVCVYNMTGIHEAFNGPYKYQENAGMAWTKMPNHHTKFQCGSSNKRNTKTNPNPRQLVDAQSFQIMDQAVQPRTVLPSFKQDNERWNLIAVDNVIGKHHDTFEVVFLANLEGVIKKMATLPNTNESCLIEEIHVIPKGQQDNIKAMELFQGMLFVSTAREALRVPVHRCQRFKNKLSCMNAMDPYCGWDSKIRACTTIPEQRSHNWHQNIVSCPVIESPVNGEWGNWSEWDTCRHVGDGTLGEECLCRTRSCDNPRPHFGGRECTGARMETTNCTINGGWTEWTDWSSCSASCGVALRTRKRSCSNPEPRYGGRVCVGSDFDEEYCHDSPECPEPTPAPVDGVWSRWSDWTICSEPCGGGIQKRNRACNFPEPSNGGKPCVGNNVEWKTCNHHLCEELRKSTDWSPWVRTNNTKDGYIEERFKFTCKAHVPNIKHIKVSNIKTDRRFCPLDGSDCGDPGAIQFKPQDGGWSRWASWSRCDALCDGGYQWRERVCNSPLPSGGGKDCIGHGREARECNTHKCTGEWSCWSEFSECSVTCGKGRKVRTRECSNGSEGRMATSMCIGNESEEIPCKMPLCNPYDGWNEWTLWSDCMPDNTMQRKRFCSLPFPNTEQCQGPTVESKMCIYGNEIPEVPTALGNSERIKEKSEIQIAHLVVVGLVGFILGGLICVGIMLFYQRQRRANKHTEKETAQFGSMPRHEVKQNIYQSPNDIDLPPVFNNNRHYSSCGSLRKYPPNITVAEAAARRNQELRANLSMNEIYQ